MIVIGIPQRYPTADLRFVSWRLHKRNASLRFLLFFQLQSAVLRFGFLVFCSCRAFI
jgi:hypothetical protein